MQLSWNKGKLDIIRYVVLGLLLLSGTILTWGNGPEIKVFYIFLALMASLVIKFNKKASVMQDVLLPIYAFVVGSYIDHALSLYNNSFLELFGTKSVTIYSLFVHGLAGYAVEFFVIVGLYFLLRAVCVPRRISAFVSVIPTILLSLTDYFVLQFRGTELTPSDILGARTAMNVVSNYKFPFLIPFILVYAPLLLYAISLWNIKGTKTPSKPRLKTSLVYLGITLFTVVTLLVSVNSISKTHKTEYLSNNPSRMNGFITNFALQIKNLRLSKPEGYNKADFENIYDVPSMEISPDTNIIIIMNESLTDMSIYNDLTGSCDDTLPYLRSMSDSPNARVGYAYSSVFGGNTCNSEFEFLTGISTAGLPLGSVPYSMYLNKPVYSLPRYLSELGYSTTALHPYFSTGWNRTTAYPSLGFDDMKFLNDFNYDDADIIRGASGISESTGFMSDECAYRNIIDMAESADPSVPQFYFLVSIQNHGGYSPDQEKLPVTDYVSGTANDPELNTYLTNVDRSDKALEMLLNTLSTSDKKYVVLIFGDHQPALQMLQQENDNSSPNARKWMVPYLLWTNYDMPSSLVGGNTETSLNYLSIDVLNAAGISLSPYYEVINDTRTYIPIINASGYYSNTTNSWHAIDDNEDALSKYYELQYYTLFDAKINED